MTEKEVPSTGVKKESGGDPLCFSLDGFSGNYSPMDKGIASKRSAIVR